jgi:hypothetical protein
MFSVITEFFYKEPNGPTLIESCTATGQRKKFFCQLEMFDVCTTGDTAHIDTIFMYLPHTRQHGYIDILPCCNNPCRWVSEVTWQCSVGRTSKCKPAALRFDSILGPLSFAVPYFQLQWTRGLRPA